MPHIYEGDRVYSTAIYYLLEGDQVSLFHKLKSDEVWHFYAGSTLALHLLKPDKSYAKILIGNNIAADEVPQIVIPRNCWFGANLINPGSYAFMGATVAPGFDFKDFELGHRDYLLKDYPEQRELILRLTK